MDLAEFQEIVRAELRPKDLLREKGLVLYSSVHSFRKWPTGVYVLGLDPGGTPGIHRTIDEDIERKEMFRKGYSALKDERWDRPSGKDKYQPGEHPYQRHALQALDLLGYDKEDDVPVSNAIFNAQPDARTLRRYPRFQDFKDACWQVHKRFLEVIQPRSILCLGASESLSSFSLIKEWSNGTYHEMTLDSPGERQTASGGKFGSVRFPFLEARTFLIGIKHPSWIRGRELPEKMANRLRKARERGMGKSGL